MPFIKRSLQTGNLLINVYLHGIQTHHKKNFRIAVTDAITMSKVLELMREGNAT